MKRVNRRTMLAATAAAGVAGLTQASKAVAAYKTKLKKALIVKEIEAGVLKQYKDAGFEGVEISSWDVAPDDAKRAREVADGCGMKIHSVLRAWLDFNDPAKIEGDILSIERALRAAQGYGADAILMVPCRLGGVAMPEPWEFNVTFDGDTCHVTGVVDGDNLPFAEYIEAQNYATDVSLAALRRLVPVAEETGVVIGVENVWNNLWVQPDFAAHFVESVGSPWVRFYYDIGNHVKYSPPEQWIRAIGKQLCKLHIKDFALAPDGHGGKFVDIRDGSVNWPSVRREIDLAGYNGWATIEGSGGLSLEQKSERLDLIIAGK